MAIDYHRLKQREFPIVRQRYERRDVLLYALGIGLGFEPLDELQLPFVTAERLRMFPTMAAVLAYPGLWIREPDTGLDWEHALHSEQCMEFLKPLPLEGEIEARTRVTGIVDKGPKRGALIYSERTGIDTATGEISFRVRHTTFARRDGGYGGPSDAAPLPHTLPDRPPDLVVNLPTVPQQALIYRLSGDPNPHNAFPAWHAPPGSTGRSCTAFAPMASPPTPSCAVAVSMIPGDWSRWMCGWRRRCFPARRCVRRSGAHQGFR
jgi:hypothetical protein